MTDDTKILAMTECLILWDYLARTGERNKAEAIIRLHDDKKLYLGEYSWYDCPLCYHLRSSGDKACDNCVWPVFSERRYARCVHRGSPYFTWQREKDEKNRKAAAKKVLDLLLSIEF